MTPSPGRHGERGFTLLELLVAMAIFATLSVMAHSGLTWLLAAEERIREARSTLDELQRGVVLISRDLRNAADRPVRIGHGAYEAPLVLGEDSPVVALTRSGWSNPAQLKRSHFQRVAYELDAEGILTRRYWQVLDRTEQHEGIEAAILTGVSSFVVRAMTTDGTWTTQWPPPTADGAAAPLARRGSLARIAALEFVLEHDTVGTIRRVMALGEPRPEKEDDASE